MRNEEIAALDAALAVRARGMFARRLTKDERAQIATLKKPQELIALLQRSPGWAAAARRLSTGDTPTAGAFSLELESDFWREFEILYRFAHEASREFLIFSAIGVRARAILAALRHLAVPDSPVFQSPLPPFFASIGGRNLHELSSASSFDEICAIADGGIFGEVLRGLPVNPETRCPVYAEAAAAIDEHFFGKLGEFLEKTYRGPDKIRLKEAVILRQTIKKLNFVLLLRRFNTPADEAIAMLAPLRGEVDAEEGESLLAAKSDTEVIKLLRQELRGIRLGRVREEDPEKFLRAAEEAYYTALVRGEPALGAVYALLVLREAELDMLRRVYVALQHGINPASYM